MCCHNLLLKGSDLLAMMVDLLVEECAACNKFRVKNLC